MLRIFSSECRTEGEMSRHEQGNIEMMMTGRSSCVYSVSSGDAAQDKYVTTASYK